MTDLTHDSVGNSNAWLTRVERWSRLKRIVLTMGITTLVIAAIWLLVTLIIGIDSSSNATLRLLIILGGGMLVYVYGWSVLVGFEQDHTQWHAATNTLWYLLIGLIALVFNITLLVIGLLSTSII